MHITRNSIRQTEIFDLIRKTFDKPRSGLHLSDLLQPRQAYFKKVSPKPMTDREISYFIIGRGHEEAMHWVTGLKKTPSKEWNEIKYGMDFFEGFPIEMKTRRGYLAKEGEEAERYDHYLKQLCGYCAVEGMNKGELWVWSLLEKTDDFRSAPEFAVYDVEFTNDEINTERSRLMNTKNLLLTAIETGNISELPLCPDWMCAKTETNMIVKPHCLTCKKDFETQWGIEKHTSSKTGMGHQYTKAEYDKKVIPACQWYEECRGEV